MTINNDSGINKGLSLLAGYSAGSFHKKFSTGPNGEATVIYRADFLITRESLLYSVTQSECMKHMQKVLNWYHDITPYDTGDILSYKFELGFGLGFLPGQVGEDPQFDTITKNTLKAWEAGDTKYLACCSLTIELPQPK